MTSIEKITAIGKLLHMYEVATEALTDPETGNGHIRPIRAGAVDHLAHGVCLEMLAVLMGTKQEEF